MLEVGTLQQDGEGDSGLVIDLHILFFLVFCGHILGLMILLMSPNGLLQGCTG